MLYILDWVSGIIAAICTVTALLVMGFGMFLNREEWFEKYFIKGFGLCIISLVVWACFGIPDSMVNSHETEKICQENGGNYQVIGQTTGSKGQKINVYGCVK